jgi:hypothetical protein
MDAVSYSHSAKQAQRIEKFIENPDSNSGIVTVPKVIGAGESVTIPTGRVAVLPNVQVDGTLNVEGEVFIPAGATFGDLESQIASKVSLNEDEVIAGIKTFSSSPIVPTPTTGTQAVNKDYADLKVALAQFTGTNQGLTANGYQKLPGGLIIQWGQNGAVQNVTFPITFPNACLTVVATMYGSSSAQQINEQSTVNYTTTGFQYTSFGWSKRWFAIGY